MKRVYKILLDQYFMDEKFFGVRYKKEICAIMCFGFIPKDINNYLMTKDAHFYLGEIKI